MSTITTRLLGRFLVVAFLASNCLTESSSQTDTMRAVRMHGRGGSEVLQLDRVPIPVADSVDSGSHPAAGVNPIDWAIREGYTPTWLKGDADALRIPGFDAAGVIVRVGDDVSGWKIGDAVIAALQSAPQGAYAEYAVVPVEDIAAKPEAISFDQAAGLPTVGATAWRYFIALAPPGDGQRVLVKAAPGVSAVSRCNSPDRAVRT